MYNGPCGSTSNELKIFNLISSLDAAQRNPGQGDPDPGLHYISSVLQVTEVMLTHQQNDPEYHFQRLSHYLLQQPAVLPLAA